ncbi:BTAD domain-containing putative transcriptional regulator [Deinococcus yavapaiensis]|uniref:AAA ATPase-like protein n=1 Tax=Deinococcus yavapaiensis KR-236 TaxID=694435 RepID=A0A318S5X4_9DEIO|nr:BTAD domain-containing putative transcriptional regulator [Deinococcus yavapaiensis]PYE49413.1 AAA ATPase-like protein [Deinococcus yavapaiensis KR-236]
MTLHAWHAHLIGAAQLESNDGLNVPLERKTAALLAYLALEGPTRRPQLTELLWPDTREEAARNNLVHLLRKLRGHTGSDLIEGGGILTLAKGMSIDASSAREAFVRGDHTTFLSFEGEVLQGLTYDDCPDLDEWVYGERERLDTWRRIALRQEIERVQQTGDYDGALVHAYTLLDLDPTSEDAHRRLMRLHYLRGDRPAALHAYQKCRDVLWRELNVEPLPETNDLARAIERGAVPTSVRTTNVALPLAVLRPPVLVGREREWERMEEAWARGQYIYVMGDPGVGKTRLAMDFARSKGVVLEFKGRHGDANQPFTSSARNYRASLERRPDVVLEPWVRRELGRVLPEFAAHGEILPPLGHSDDLLRYRRAMLELCRAAWSDVDVVLVDDIQFYDHPSLVDGVFFFGQPEHPGHFPRAVCTFRRGELQPDMQREIDELVRLSLAVLIDVPNLAMTDTHALLSDLGVPDDERFRDRLARYSGGSPLFALEIVKHLVESGAFETDENLATVKLPLTPKVGEVIARRLERLSAPALGVARAAAVLQSDFDLEQIAEVLGGGLLDVAQAWEELERAQVVSGDRFTHDLVYEAVEAAMPSSVRQLLHRSVARMLERFGSGAARIAHHWRAGGKASTAAPWWVRAGEDALEGFQLDEAARFFEAAAEEFERGGEHARASDVRSRMATVNMRSS